MSLNINNYHLRAPAEFTGSCSNLVFNSIYGMEKKNIRPLTYADEELGGFKMMNYESMAKRNT